MSIALVNRRDFLTLALAALLAPARLAAGPVDRRGTFAADVGILYQMLTFHMTGDVQESVDRGAGRYEVRISALLNYRDGAWAPGPDGRLHTSIVRRRRSSDEGPDDVAQSYRAELAPLDLKIEPDQETRKPAALLDLSRFSSWARPDRPARVVFDDERRPTLITGSMILGTSVTIRLA
jgi:hypothetical protein